MNLSTFERNGYGWKSVITVSDAELNKYPEGDVIFSLQQNDLLKREGDYHIYVYQNNYLSHIPDEYTFNINGYGWENVGSTPAVVFDSLPKGPSLLTQGAKETIRKIKEGVISVKNLNKEDFNALVGAGDDLGSFFLSESGISFLAGLDANAPKRTDYSSAEDYEDTRAEFELQIEIAKEVIEEIFTPEELAVIGVAQIPGVGDLYDFVNIFRSTDLITGEKLSFWDRALSFGVTAAIVSGYGEGLSSKNIKAVGKINKVRKACQVGITAHKLFLEKFGVSKIISKAINASNIDKLVLGNRAIRGPDGKVFSRLRPDIVDYEKSLIIELKSGIRTTAKRNVALEQAAQYKKIFDESWKSKGKIFKYEVQWIDENGNIIK